MTPTPALHDGGGDNRDGGGGGGPDAPEGEVEMIDATLLRDVVNAGTPVVVRVELANYDPTSGHVTLELVADGSTVAARTVAVRASTERTVTLRGRLADPGEYDVDVNGLKIGPVEVREPPAESTPSGEETPADPPADALPGAGPPESGSAETVRSASAGGRRASTPRRHAPG
ncbi:MAG: hypothetical protein V5A27_06695 [Halapricum sp.]